MKAMHDGDSIKVKISGDGSWFRTTVTDAETGARIRGISAIVISAPDIYDNMMAKLTVFPMSVDMVVPGEIYVDGLAMSPEERATLIWAVREALAVAHDGNRHATLSILLGRLERGVRA